MGAIVSNVIMLRQCSIQYFMEIWIRHVWSRGPL